MIKPTPLILCASLPLFISTSAAAGTLYPTQPWPNRTVYYAFDARVPESIRHTFNEVIAEINSKTTVKYRPFVNSGITSQQPKHLKIIKVNSRNENSCYATQGYRQRWKNGARIEINDNYQCATHDSVLGHLVKVLGLPDQYGEWINGDGTRTGRLSNNVIQAINDYADRPDDFNPHGFVIGDSPYSSSLVIGPPWPIKRLTIPANTSQEGHYKTVNLLIKNGKKFKFEKIESAHKVMTGEDSMFKVEEERRTIFRNGNVLFQFTFTPKIGRTGTDEIAIHFTHKNLDEAGIQTQYLPVSTTSPAR